MLNMLTRKGKGKATVALIMDAVSHSLLLGKGKAHDLKCVSYLVAWFLNLASMEILLRSHFGCVFWFSSFLP